MLQFMFIDAYYLENCFFVGIWVLVVLCPLSHPHGPKIQINWLSKWTEIWLQFSKCMITRLPVLLWFQRNTNLREEGVHHCHQTHHYHQAQAHHQTWVQAHHQAWAWVCPQTQARDHHQTHGMGLPPDTGMGLPPDTGMGLATAVKVTENCNVAHYNTIWQKHIHIKIPITWIMIWMYPAGICLPLPRLLPHPLLPFPPFPPPLPLFSCSHQCSPCNCYGKTNM